jgi:hypothetical protein
VALAEGQQRLDAPEPPPARTEPEARAPAVVLRLRELRLRAGLEQRAQRLCTLRLEGAEEQLLRQHPQLGARARARDEIGEGLQQVEHEGVLAGADAREQQPRRLGQPVGVQGHEAADARAPGRAPRAPVEREEVAVEGAQAQRPGEAQVPGQHALLEDELQPVDTHACGRGLCCTQCS